MQEQRRHAREWLAPAGLVALLVAVKAWIFLSLADVYFLGEELARGSVAKALMDDLPVPWHQTVYWYYEGGGFVSSLLALVAFGALGPSLLAHKVVALGYNVAILLAGWRLMRWSFGWLAALLFGLFFVFAPEGFQKISLLNLGTHYDALLFLILILHLGLWIVLEDDAPLWTFAALGLVAGFACYFDYQNAPAVALIGLIVGWTRRRRLFGLAGALALGAFAVGALPLVVMWSRVGAEIFDVHGTHLFGAEAAPAEPAVPWGEVVASVVAGESASDLVLLALLYALPVAGAATLALRRQEVPRRALVTAAVVLAHAVLIGVLYLRSDFRMPRFDQTYFALGRFCPFWLIALVLTAAFLGWLLERPTRALRVAGAALAGIVLVGGVRETARVLRAGRPLAAANFELLATTKGYSYVEYLPYLKKHLDGDLDHHLRVALAFDERDPEALHPEVAQALFIDADLALAEIQTMARAAAPDEGSLLLLGLGPWLTRAGFARAVERVRSAPPGLQATLWEALGRWPSHRHATARNLAQEIEIARELDLPEPFWRGLGHRVYRAFRLDPAAGRAFAAKHGREAPPLTAGFERAAELSRVGGG